MATIQPGRDNTDRRGRALPLIHSQLEEAQKRLQSATARFATVHVAYAPVRRNGAFKAIQRRAAVVVALRRQAVATELDFDLLIEWDLDTDAPGQAITTLQGFLRDMATSQNESLEGLESVKALKKGQSTWIQSASGDFRVTRQEIGS